MNVETLLMVVAIMVYTVARQLVGEPLRVKRLVGLPAVLTVIGVVDVATSGVRVPTGTDIVLIAAGVAINVVIGIGQGRLMRLESRDGYLWGQMPKSVLWWWAAKIVSAVVLDGIGYALGAQLATTSAVLLLRLGVNRLAQAAVVAPRALATGVPFAPEPQASATAPKRDSEDRLHPVASPSPSTSAETSSMEQVCRALLIQINDWINDARRRPTEQR
jgi:hypothetical protein